MREGIKIGLNTVLSDDCRIGVNNTIGHNCIIEDGVEIGDECYIDSNTIIRSGTKIGNHAFIGSNCILGEYQMDFIRDKNIDDVHVLSIGDYAIIRSGTIIYSGSEIGHHFQTGHQANIRENSSIGNYVRIGTLSDIQGDCVIHDYVRAHSNVHIAQHTIIESFVWLFPYVVFTNDPTPPSEKLIGAYICSFAVIATHSVIIPGVKIGQDALVGAGSVVNRDVEPYTLVSGNPAKKITDVRYLNLKAEKMIYPWRNSFERGMPWSGIGFKEWYQKLSLQEKKDYCIRDLI